MSVNFYKSTGCNIAEDSFLHALLSTKSSCSHKAVGPTFLYFTTTILPQLLSMTDAHFTFGFTTAESSVVSDTLITSLLSLNNMLLQQTIFHNMSHHINPFVTLFLFLPICKHYYGCHSYHHTKLSFSKSHLFSHPLITKFGTVHLHSSHVRSVILLFLNKRQQTRRRR
jgi:hypothetical protein